MHTHIEMGYSPVLTARVKTDAPLAFLNLPLRSPSGMLSRALPDGNVCKQKANGSAWAGWQTQPWTGSHLLQPHICCHQLILLILRDSLKDER